MPWIEFNTTVEGKVGHYRQRSATATAYEGFSDIFQCDARFPDESCILVAVKRLRAVKMCKSLDTYQIDHKLQKRLNREVKIWTALQHSNIAPLLGFSLSGEVCVISAWFANGNIGAHLEANPNADRMELIRQVAAGVAYLHGRNPVVVHGDLKPDNVLIDDDGVPKLIDFGLSKVVEDGVRALSSTSLRDVGNARWIAPELLLDEEASRSCSTDTFSFGCVAFFIFTGDVPFKSNSDRTLYLSRYNGAQPMRSEADYPVLQRTELVNLLRSCWEVNPDQRPTMSEVVVQCLEEPPPSLKSLQFKGQGMLLKFQQIALRRDIDPIVRQQAIAQAKNDTRLQWKSRANTSEEDLIQLRQNFFLFIDEPDEVVARNNQMMLAKAARVDFPSRWPDLLDTIMGHIQVNVQARLASPSPDEGVLLRSRRSLGLLNAVLKEFLSMRSLLGRQICTKASAKVCPFLAPLVEQLTTLLNTSLTPAPINRPSTVYDVEITHLSWKCWSKMMLWAWGRAKELSPEEEQAFRDTRFVAPTPLVRGVGAVRILL